MQQPSNQKDHFITRGEFETFERNVDRSFSEVSRSLENINRKLDSKGTTDFKTIFSGISVFILLLSIIWGAFHWGLTNKLTSETKRTDFLEQRLYTHEIEGKEINSTQTQLLNTLFTLSNENRNKIENIINTRWSKEDAWKYVFPRIEKLEQRLEDIK